MSFFCSLHRVLFALFILVFQPVFAADPFRSLCFVTPKNPQFVTDDQGRALFLHGVNVSHDTKHDPLNVGSTTQADINRIASDWGFNFSRLLLQWDGIEPMKGFYDEAYFARIKERLDWHAEAGLYVLLDMHQDLFLENGIPDWAIRTDGWLHINFGTWWLNAISPDAVRAIDNFYNADGPHGDVQTHFVKAWQEVVRRYKDHPAVIGYDLLNEPSNGSYDYFTFEREQLKPLYERTIRAIREIDNDTYIFYEPQSFAVNSGFPSFLGKVKDSREGEARLGYAPHYYQLDMSLSEDAVYNGKQFYIKLWAWMRTKELNKQVAPLILGEFGGMASLAENGEILMRNIANMADCMLGGWAFWNYSASSQMLDEFGEETKVVDYLVRTYAPEVAGVPVLHVYDPETRVFTLVFEDDASIEGTTNIYIPPRHYPNGWVLTVSDPESSWSSEWDEVSRILSIKTDNSVGVHEIVITPQ